LARRHTAVSHFPKQKGRGRDLRDLKENRSKSALGRAGVRARRRCRVRELRQDVSVSKASKRLRDCPALGCAITPADCGARRGSVYQCPVECSYFPFTPANYEKHGEIESRLIQKTYARASREMTAAERESMLRVLDESEGAADEVLANHARFAWLYHWRRDAEGRTFAERWLADVNNGLTNDERVLLAGMNAMRPALVEVHRILDDQTIEGVDLLDGSPLRIVDRANAAAVARYSTLLMWVYPMRHYDRTSGGALFIPEVAEMAPDEIVREIIRHLGGPSDPDGERAWLAEHFVRTCEALGAVQLARWHDTMSALDARYTKTDYRALNSERLCSLLAKRKDVIEDPLAEDDRAHGFEKGYAWLKNASEPAPDQLALPLTSEAKVGAAPLILGRVLAGRERIRIEAMTSARHQELRTRFERFAAGQVEFIGERTDDIGAQTLERHAPAFDAALVPPRLRENPQQIAITSQRLTAVEGDRELTLLEAFRQQYATFADEPLPWLNGRTPRAAAADTALRPRLIRLMKTHIRSVDDRRRKEGLDLDLNPLLAELGLHELISEPPPLGLAEDADDDLDDETSEAFDERTSMSREGAVLPPLTERDVERRLKTMNARYPSPDSAADAIDNRFPGLLDLFLDVTQTMLEDDEAMFLEMAVVRVCHLIKPATGPAPAPDFGRILRDFPREFAGVSKIVLDFKKSSAAFERWISDGPQPAVMQDLSGVLLAVVRNARGKKSPRPEAVLVILACAKALVAELARAQG
jgi:hypothetical protein